MRGRRRRVVPWAVGAFLVAQVAAYQVTANRSRTAVVVLEPLGEASGYACLEAPGRDSPGAVSIQGSYVLDAHDGRVVVSPVAGSVRVRILLYRHQQVWRSREARVPAGSTLRMGPTWLGIRSTSETGFHSCGTLLTQSAG